jgi:hypothetical protein
MVDELVYEWEDAQRTERKERKELKERKAA